ncbi:MAG TPA: hypothetical protein VE913_25065, partial [Longimicrobium sp.]|nr:hypothetical protein [Longimicrobium sp.]
MDAAVGYSRAHKDFRGSLSPAGAAPDGGGEGWHTTWVRLAPPADLANPRPGLYFAGRFEWATLARAAAAAGRGGAFRLLSRAATERVLARALPPRLSYAHDAGEPFVPLERRLDAMAAAGPVRVAVLHMSHLALGDAL